MIHNPEWILLSRVRTHNHQMTAAAKAMAVAPRRDDGLGAALVEPFAQRLAVVSLVGDEFGGWWQCSDAGLGDLAVVDVSRRQQEDGPWRRRRHGPWCSDRLWCGRYHGPSPPFPPPAQRCTLMQLLSMKGRSGTPSAPASALKMPSQTPRPAQRTKRLYSVFFGPYTSAQSAQRPPQRSACTIPLSTRRSSTRALPRTSVGSSGAIRSHCASENQKKSDIAPPPHRGSESPS